MTAYENAISQIRTNQNALTARVLYPDALFGRKRLVYNAGITKESYFRSTPLQTGGFNIGPRVATLGGLWRILQTDVPSNTPALVEAASTLWSKSQAYKGMITTSYHREQPSTDDKVAAQTNDFVPPLVNSNGVSYGFQFHYNPGSVSMDYAGPPPVDVTLQTSGREKFNTYGPLSGSGSISFQLVLNRVNDMKYFDVRTGRLKPGVPNNVFSGRRPELREEVDIYNRGTMYDMEFLFRTLLGYQLPSYLGRGMSWDKKTADLGWLGGKPVELHLGKSLRFLTRVTRIQITHVLFTERMVPTFSEVGITLQRIPDTMAATREAAVTPTPTSRRPAASFLTGPLRLTGG